MKEDRKEKIQKLYEEQKDQLIQENETNKTEFEIHFVVNEKPIAYARARSGRGHFFNPKAADEKRYRNLFKAQLTVDEYQKLKPLMEDPDSRYYVEITSLFYIPINVSDSISTSVAKAANIIPATTRNGDVDNYTKFILDSLHEVVYTDDMRVTSITSKKYYALEPRSEIFIKIITY